MTGISKSQVSRLVFQRLKADGAGFRPGPGDAELGQEVARQILGLNGPDLRTFRSSQGRSASLIACAPHAPQVGMVAPCRELQTGIA